MLQYREIKESEINRELFRDFIRHQVVTDCWRRENDKWVVKADPFIDKKMGCIEATEYCPKHVEEEPCDCQLECRL